MKNYIGDRLNWKFFTWKHFKCFFFIQNIAYELIKIQIFGGLWNIFFVDFTWKIYFRFFVMNLNWQRNIFKKTVSILTFVFYMYNDHVHSKNNTGSFSIAQVPKKKKFVIIFSTYKIIFWNFFRCLLLSCFLLYLRLCLQCILRTFFV